MARNSARQFGLGRRTSGKAAEQYARQATERARQRYVARKYGRNLAEQSAKAQGRPVPAGPPSLPGRAGRPGEMSGERAASGAQWQRMKAQRKRQARRRPHRGGYRSDDPRYQAKSLYYAYGVEDATRDCQIVANCPPGDPIGPDPERTWSCMYRRGYEDKIADATPHICTDRCRKNGGDWQE